MKSGDVAAVCDWTLDWAGEGELVLPLPGSVSSNKFAMEAASTLLRLATPECILRCKHALPEELVEEYLRKQEHFDFVKFVMAPPPLNLKAPLMTPLADSGSSPSWQPAIDWILTRSGLRGGCVRVSPLLRMSVCAQSGAEVHCVHAGHGRGAGGGVHEADWCRQAGFLIQGQQCGGTEPVHRSDARGLRKVPR